jgi:cell division protein YceG involved in septum cleavage
VAAPKGANLYFVAGCPNGERDGSHYFAKTNGEHEANIAKANEECAGQ